MEVASWPFGRVIRPPATASEPTCTGSPVEPMSANTSAGYPLYCVPTLKVAVGVALVIVTTEPASPATMFEWVKPSGMVRLPDPSVAPLPIGLPSAQTESVVLGSHGSWIVETGAPL